MPAKTKKKVKKISKPTLTPPPPPVPTVNPDAPLAVEKELSESVPDATLETPLAVESASEPTEQPGEQPEEEVKTERTDRTLFVLGSVVTAVVALAVVGIVVLFVTTRTTPAPTPRPEADQPLAGTPTPAPLSRGTISFEVLNGSGVAGAAGKAALQLTDLGYAVVAIGNTEVSRGTELRVASIAATHASAITEDIQRLFTQATFSGVLTDSTAAAQLIIGKP